ncbi:bifunctional 3'-5' exonuclease/DNA polymerase [uncultured Microbacterium sp.]|uniref:bifunctional 3'-5' exonuclease/DNA polymerase n=1 Tax=uncultured Microbacterium sp. TaxID=191216 RepID=UPI00262E0621|nr:bifunctional 3'-5' exonuclease/DNA polymerase [uncultured Microbacterium sp.]
MNPVSDWLCVARDGDVIVVADSDDTPLRRLTAAEWHRAVRDADPRTRWVWDDSRRWYPDLLAAGIEVARCRDLRLAHAILRASDRVTDPSPLRAATEWNVADAETLVAAPDAAATLFDVDEEPGSRAGRGVPSDLASVRAEFARQQAAVAASADPDRLRLLLAAESAGALLAIELHTAGLPWSRSVHDGILTERLGARPAQGRLPSRVEVLAAEVRAALNDSAASLDSQPKLLRALHRVGVLATSTSKWELEKIDHPVIEPLLAYKKLTRLLSANGWAWLDEWAPDGRFRPVYVPAGVVTGRWASSGGGALQLPRELRPAVHADPGWMLIVADVAQLEPRVLAAMARDESLAAAARGTDLYEGIVAGGVVATRQEAKFAVLGAMYGATTGDSGRLVPALRRAYPRAMGLVDEAARIGDEGGIVTTWLGRSSPPPSPEWREVQSAASASDASEADRLRARRSARDRGRFTRNFVVQGTAAEWAAAWLADLRAQLAAFPRVDAGDAAPASGAVFGSRAHLAFFLHDEIIVHAPRAHADRAAAAVRSAAERATTLLFGTFPIDFPLDLRITSDAAKS